MNPKSPSDLSAPIPTPQTLRMRHSVLWQIWRFVWINLRMLRMISLSHPHRIPPSKR